MLRFADMILGVCAMALMAQVQAQTDKVVGATFFVATDGNDAWSGKLSGPNAARSDGPFATLGQARDAVRQLKAREGGLKQTVTVQVRGGVYHVAETITLTPEDSGTKECPVSYVAYPGEKPVLRGGKRVTGWSTKDGRIYAVTLPDVKAGRWHFRSLFVDGERQIRARCPNVDASDPCRKGFFYVDRGLGGFGAAVGNIHNPGDWMEYKVQVPADGEYRFWMYYGALNKPFGNTDMGGRTVLTVDGGAPIPLMNLPDTGGWGEFKWSQSATVRLTKGEHLLRWQNVKGGGLNLEAYALTDDPDWKPVTTKLPKTADGKHLLVIQAEDFVRFNGKQLSVGGGGGSKTEFHYKAGTFKPSWAQAPGAEVHIFQSGS
ncbi:MAG: carbohydrate-binding protein, partial [Planctomycetes bacterium]|nr:carbohydrate-binding protein [Planctomycetota bacterium]